MSNDNLNDACAGVNEIRQAALDLSDRGFVVIDFEPGAKGPVTPEWGRLAHERSRNALAAAFDGPRNLGLLLGPGDLVDVDLDCQEAVEVAELFLPPTGMVHGRPSAPRSHWWYRSPDAPFAPLRDAPSQSTQKTMIAELRSGADGKQRQSMVPPSWNAARGERVRWDDDGEPAQVPAEELERAVRLLAATVGVARRWPGVGSRHHAVGALAGFLGRRGVAEADVQRMVEGIVRLTGGSDLSAKRALVSETFTRLADSDQQVTGGPALREALVDSDRILDWLAGTLQLDATGGLAKLPFPDKPHTALPNYVAVIEQDEELAGLRYDTFACQHDFRGELIDLAQHRVKVQDVLLKKYGWHGAARTHVEDAMLLVGQRNQFDSRDDWLRSLPGWDGRERWGDLVELLDVDPTDEFRELFSVYLKRWFVQAIVAVKRVGVELSDVLVLQGEQGRGKSSFFRYLLPEPYQPRWFSRSKLEMSTDEGMRKIQGTWIFELQEMAAVFGARGQEDVKAFLSDPFDTFRDKYGRDAMTHPRKTVFGASVNQSTFLRDLTGSRRFLAIPHGESMERDAIVGYLEKNREQLFAHAIALFEAGEPGYLQDYEQLIQRESNKRFLELSSVVERALAWLEEREEDPTFDGCVRLQDVVEVACDRPNPKDEAQVRDALVGRGYGYRQRLPHPDDPGKQIKPRSFNNPTVWERHQRMRAAVFRDTGELAEFLRTLPDTEDPVQKANTWWKQRWGCRAPGAVITNAMRQSGQ